MGSRVGSLGSVRSPPNGVESSLLGSLGSVRTPHNGVESTSSAKIQFSAFYQSFSVV